MGRRRYRWYYKAKVYTDGACINNHTFDGERHAGLGVYWPKGECEVGKALIGLDLCESIDGRQTNNRAEILAACRAIEQALDEGIPNLDIRTDSQFLIKLWYEYIPVWKDNDWFTKRGKRPENYIEAVELDDWMSECEGRCQVRFMKVVGHAGVEGNEAANRLAQQAARNAANGYVCDTDESY